MQRVYNEAVKMQTIAQREEHLKGYGLRNVEVHEVPSDCD